MEEKLIAAVRKHEVLYNKNSLLYKNKFKRAAAWNAISRELHLPEDVCQTRWRYLRDRYVKSISESHQASGSGAEVVEGQWQYQSQMEFLRERIRPRKTVTSLSQGSMLTELEDLSENVESMPEAFSEIEFLDDLPSTSASNSSTLKVPGSNRKRQRRESDTEAFGDFLNKMSNIAEARFSRTESDPHDGFFGMVREIFAKMEPEDVEDTKFFFISYLDNKRRKK